MTWSLAGPQCASRISPFKMLLAGRAAFGPSGKFVSSWPLHAFAMIQLRMKCISPQIWLFLRVASVFCSFAPSPSVGWPTMSLTPAEALCWGWRTRSRQLQYHDGNCWPPTRSCWVSVFVPNYHSHRRHPLKLRLSSLTALANHI